MIPPPCFKEGKCDFYLLLFSVLNTNTRAILEHLWCIDNLKLAHKNAVDLTFLTPRKKSILWILMLFILVFSLPLWTDIPYLVLYLFKECLLEEYCNQVPSRIPKYSITMFRFNWLLTDLLISVSWYQLFSCIALKGSQQFW